MEYTTPIKTFSLVKSGELNILTLKWVDRLLNVADHHATEDMSTLSRFIGTGNSGNGFVKSIVEQNGLVVRVVVIPLRLNIYTDQTFQFLCAASLEKFLKNQGFEKES